MQLLNQKNYEDAIEAAHNIKTLIKDKEVFSKAETHDKKVDEEYTKRYAEETKAHGDPWDRYNKAMGFLGKLTIWKARETMRFYNSFVKEHDF